MSSVLPNKRFNTSTILHCLIRGPCGPGAPECVACPRLGGDVREEDFVVYMKNLGLAHPKLIDVAVPANLRCGEPEFGFESMARLPASAQMMLSSTEDFPAPLGPATSLHEGLARIST